MKKSLLIIAISGMCFLSVGCKRLNECRCQVFVGNQELGATSLVTKMEKSQARDWCGSFNSDESLGEQRAITTCYLN